MKLILENIHGNSTVSELGDWLWGKQITIVPNTHGDARDHFSELYCFFCESLGPSVDIQTLKTLRLRPHTSWTYQIESRYSQHRFFVKDHENLDWFLIKYSDKLTRWA